MKEFIATMMAHKVSAGVLAFLGTGLGASIFARLLNMIPMDPVFAAIRAAAAGVSAAGNAGPFRLVYQPLEDWFEKFIMGAAKAVCEGLQLDSQVTVAPSNPPTPLPVAPGPIPPPVPAAQPGPAGVPPTPPAGPTHLP